MKKFSLEKYVDQNKYRLITLLTPLVVEFLKDNLKQEVVSEELPLNQSQKWLITKIGNDIISKVVISKKY
jgi:hypothetical protein